MDRKSRRMAASKKKGALYGVLITAGVLLVAFLWIGFMEPVRLFLPPPPTPAPTLAITPSPAPTSTPSPTPAPEPTPITITLTAAGDVTLGGDTRRIGTFAAFDKVWRAEDSEYFLKNLEPIFTASDITIVNLEGPLTTAEKRVSKTHVFKGRPEYAKILSAGGVNLCNLGNNHALDYYAQGLKDTKAALDAEGIAHFGFSDAYVTEIKGVTFGFCGYWAKDMDISEVKRTIRSLREDCDIVVVSFHWGTEYKYTPDRANVSLAKTAIDDGADLVLGHHPHVVGAIEQYKGKYIVYSLGNACFGGNFNPSDSDSMLFQQTFILEDGAIVDGGINIIPIRISSNSKRNNYQPVLLNEKDSQRLFAKVNNAGKDLANPIIVGR